MTRTAPSRPWRTLAVAALALVACSAPRKAQVGTWETAVFAGDTGERAELEDVLDAIDGADVVVLGELHGHPAGLAWNQAVFEASLERHPEAALCLEFLTRDTQYLVDAYADGLIDWDGLQDACDGVPGSNPTPHRPLIDAACAADAPIVAANAPRIYTRAARQQGYDRLTTLTDEQQRLFDVPTVQPGGGYRESFFDKVLEHGPETPEEPDEANERAERVFRAQCLWDMTMASSVTRSFEAGRRPVFLVVGSFHCNHDGGTVQMIREQRPDAEIVVVTFVAEEAMHLLDEHVEMADFVAYVGPRP